MYGFMVIKVFVIFWQDFTNKIIENTLYTYIMSYNLLFHQCDQASNYPLTLSNTKTFKNYLKLYTLIS